MIQYKGVRHRVETTGTHSMTTLLNLEEAKSYIDEDPAQGEHN